MIVLDVKYGSGAFMKTAEEAESLALRMADIGKRLGKRVSALIPGCASSPWPRRRQCSGGAGGLRRAVRPRGQGLAELRRHRDGDAVCRRRSRPRVYAAGFLPRSAAAAGWKSWPKWWKRRAATPRISAIPSVFRKARFRRTLYAPSDGWVAATDALAVGRAACALGAGRSSKDAPIDHAAGILLERVRGEYVRSGGALATLFADSIERLDEAEALLADESACRTKNRSRQKRFIKRFVEIKEMPAMSETFAESDVEIAAEADKKPITEIAARLGLTADDIEPYGKYKAKITAEAMARLSANRDAKLILVTAINPTPAGEGKTTTTVGLADRHEAAGQKGVIVALREPSLGPVFGIKGGAAGGGYAQVVPMEDINLHFTGDFHAIGAANNLLAAMLDNHIHQGNALGIDPQAHRTWKRCVDMNDRAAARNSSSASDGQVQRRARARTSMHDHRRDARSWRFSALPIRTVNDLKRAAGTDHRRLHL